MLNVVAVRAIVYHPLINSVSHRFISQESNPPKEVPV